LTTGEKGSIPFFNLITTGEFDRMTAQKQNIKVAISSSAGMEDSKV